MQNWQCPLRKWIKYNPIRWTTIWQISLPYAETRGWMSSLINTASAFRLSRSLASSSSFSCPQPRLFLSSSFALPPRPIPHFSLTSLRASLSFRTEAASATATMGDAPDAGMDAVQRRLMFEDEWVFWIPLFPFKFYWRFFYFDSFFFIIFDLGLLWCSVWFLRKWREKKWKKGKLKLKSTDIIRFLLSAVKLYYQFTRNITEL